MLWEQVTERFHHLWSTIEGHERMANGSRRLFGLSDFTDEVDHWTVVRLALFGFRLIAETIHAVATNEEESDVIIQFDVLIDVFVDSYRIMAFVALEFQHVVTPQGRNEIHLNCAKSTTQRLKLYSVTSCQKTKPLVTRVLFGKLFQVIHQIASQLQWH